MAHYGRLEHKPCYFQSDHIGEQAILKNKKAGQDYSFL